MLSIIFPIRDEEKNLQNIIEIFQQNKFDFNFEIIFVNDFSKDKSFEIIKKLEENNSNIISLDNKNKGIGGAINLAINHAKGNYCCIMMADLSDSLQDLKKYYEIISNKRIDAVFGSRFIRGSKCTDYPLKKLILNRIFNIFVKIIYFNKYNDYTNAFKIYKKESLKSTLPLVSESFNIFLEIPLKIIGRKLKYEIVPISWQNRKSGQTKFKIDELKSKYLFTLIYCLIEKVLLKK